jgi:uncharacterized membrane protein HdeD (DUF308 family)
MQLTQKFAVEAVAVGAVLLIIGKFINQFKFKKYNFELTLFISGILTHLAFELAGFNKWYCTNGNACSS